MAEYHIPDSSHQRTGAAKHTNIIPNENEQQDESEKASIPTRHRTGSFIDWVQKTYSHAKETIVHPHGSSQRPRASSIGHHHHHQHHKKHRDTTDSSDRVRPISYHPTTHQGRPRSSSFNSTQKKVISDTDEQAQQTPSLFQFALGR